MKKKIVLLLAMFVMTSSICMAKSYTNSELSNIIKLYKSGNYSECYIKLNKFLEKNNSNALAYYYMGMTSAHMGRKEEAIENYGKAIVLAGPNSNLTPYAEKGRRCLESPEQCSDALYASPLDDFIQNKRSGMFQEEAKGQYEKLKIENLMREMNRSDEIDPQKFKEYRDFSSMNPQGAPTNDEIVAALRTLQRAGLGDIFSHNAPDLSMFADSNNNNNYDYINMMGSAMMNPKLIQSLMTNSMGF